MNARNLSAMIVAMLLGAQAGALAESEREEEKSTESRTSLTQALPSPDFKGSVDFRRPSITDGSFDEPSSGAFKAFGVGMFAAAGADLASTELGLARPFVYESNPFQGNRNVRLLTHVAAPAFMYWVTDKLHDRGKTKAALLARIGFSVAYSYVVMHNLHTASAIPQ